MMGLSGALAYNNVSAVSGVEDADPHMLIQMLIDGAIEKTNKAKYFMKQEKIEPKGQHISWAISIINGLKSSLDTEKGGDVAANLDSLYEYCAFTLVEANANNDLSKLDSVLTVLNEVRSGWNGIREQALEINKS